MVEHNVLSATAAFEGNRYRLRFHAGDYGVGARDSAVFHLQAADAKENHTCEHTGHALETIHDLFRICNNFKAVESVRSHAPNSFR